MSDDSDRTASLMTPAKLAQLKPKPAASPAAWLDQLASDAGGLHVRRLVELNAQLQAHVPAAGCEELAQSLVGLQQVLPQLDFSLLQPRGWLARATGKARSAGADFAQQYEQAAQAAQDLRHRAQALQQGQQAAAAATERTLVEIEVEWRALEKILDQGARWLQDMRNQLKARQAEAQDDAARDKVREDAARCELLVARLKLLRAISSAAQQAHEQARTTGARRATLSQAVQQVCGHQLKAWQSQLAALATAAAEGSPPTASVQDAIELQRELLQRAQQAAGGCAQLQEQEQALAANLGALGQQLQAAA